ncbi:MAG: AraC family transcriptional regulator [Desulfobacterales bacterium]|nr:AraC family transcriptional regulator [Desulfobacterales bacterium]
MLYKKHKTEGIEVLSCTSSFRFKPHIHDSFVLWISGGCSEHYFVNGKSDILSKGHISIFNPHVVHENSSCSEYGRDLRSFYIERSFLDSLSSQITDKDNVGFSISQCIQKDRALFNNLLLLHDFLLQNNSETESALYDILSEFVVRYGENINEKIFKGNNDKRIRLSIEYMNDKFDEKISVQELAKLVNCSTFHLIKYFKNKKGLTPHAYLIQIRLEKAKNMMNQGEKLSDIALNCGFSDQSHLSRNFKARYGITPKKYSRLS